MNFILVNKDSNYQQLVNVEHIIRVLPGDEGCTLHVTAAPEAPTLTVINVTEPFDEIAESLGGHK